MVCRRAILAKTDPERLWPRCRQTQQPVGAPYVTHSRAYYHEHPDTLTLEAEVLHAEPGRVHLSQTPFFAGGGGQVADRGLIRAAGGEHAIAGFEEMGGRLWHVLTEPVELKGTVQAVVDADFRRMMSQLHTATHILNAVVFQEFNGALVTGVQMSADGTARMDFDLPGVDNARLRLVEEPINATIRQDLPVTDSYIPLDEAIDAHGLIRNQIGHASAHARRHDPHRRDRGAGSPGVRGHALASTGRSGPIRIVKIDNKGRSNRRIRIALVDRIGG